MVTLPAKSLAKHKLIVLFSISYPGDVDGDNPFAQFHVVVVYFYQKRTSFVSRLAVGVPIFGRRYSHSHTPSSLRA